MDPTIREQTYRYFVQEAPELLHALEQGLVGFKADRSINQVHNLLRATHTLKGAATSVGLETIATVAHSLEDIFKALCKPDLAIDSEVEALLFEGIECLRLPLVAELSGRSVNQSEILNRTAAVFAQLQEKLGDCFDPTTQLPTSEELGFDVTQTIFEVGVAQRLEQLAVAISQNSSPEITTLLRTQSEVFLGIAESLNLPGFGAIAKATIAALNHHPDQVIPIAQQALADFQSGQAAVLAGDRSQGGQLSPSLQQLASLTSNSSENSPEAVTEEGFSDLLENIWGDSPISESISEPISASISTYISDDFDTEIDTPIAEAGAVETGNIYLESIHFEDTQDVHTHDVHTQDVYTQDVYIQNEYAQDEYVHDEGVQDEYVQDEYVQDEYVQNEHTQSKGIQKTTINIQNTNIQNKGTQNETARNEQESSFLSTAAFTTPISISQDDSAQKNLGSPPTIVRVNLKHLDHLNYSVGELLTQQNRQSLQNEQLQSTVRTLLDRLKQHQQQLNQLHRSSHHPAVSSAEQNRKGRRSRKKGNTSSLSSSIQNTSVSHRDSDLTQFLLDDVTQLTETAEAIDLFARQAIQTQEKQRQLLSNTRNALIEARMMPLGEIFGRFSQVLQQLGTLHNKPVTLKLQGMDVLIDKAIAEKLYDPLLHLVRNAFDHGIEPIAIRQQHGKPEKGQIEITAHNQGRYLVIEVCDDGKGLDFELIRYRAVSQQKISAEQVHQLDQTQLIELLFEPGFSTAAQVSDLSGRGIGLDVVRNQLKALRGGISIQTEPHRGTTFKLQIPLSLTIAPLLICKAGSQTYALLDDAIEQVIIPRLSQLQERHGGRALKWNNGQQEQLVPIYPLTALLKYDAVSYPPPSLEPQVHQRKELAQPIILMRCQEIYLGLEVDRLIGEQELVIRPLGSLIEPPDYVHGASIQADGRLTLVLDGALLVQAFFKEMQNNSVHNSAFNSASLSSQNYGANPLAQSLLPHAQNSLLSQNPGDPSALADPPPSPRRVLVVEDSITSRQALVLTLQKAGYQVLQAQNGQEAIAQIQQHSHIQLVICDLEMPGMNGFEFLRQSQQMPTMASIPILILTSRSDHKHRSLASQLGATAYMTKPYIEYKLLAVVNELLEQTQMNSTLI